MQITGISSMTSAGQQATLSNPSTATASKSTATTTAASDTATTAAASTTSTASSSSSSSKSSGGGGGGGETTATAAEKLAGVYTTTVNGKSYSGSVEESNGTYTVSVANLPGASASGSSAASAENALGILISVLA